MFAKCLNMMKNENVLLDPNSEALCGGGGLLFPEFLEGVNCLELRSTKNL